MFKAVYYRQVEQYSEESMGEDRRPERSEFGPTVLDNHDEWQGSSSSCLFVINYWN